MSPTAKFKPGDRVLVSSEDRPGHIRTPYFIRGKSGWVERVHGEFLNPELLAYGKDGLPKKTLYLVGFLQRDVWDQYGEAPQDKVYVDIFEHWLEPL